MYISGNYIGNVNHTAIQLGSMTVKELLSITENHILNWNKDGIAGTGAQGSQGDGIYLPKGSTPETVPVQVNQNYIAREKELPGSAGFATRCNSKKGAIDLSANYWNEVYPYKVISGGTYANVTVKSVCDEHMNNTAKHWRLSVFYFHALQQRNGQRENAERNHSDAGSGF